MRDLSHMQVAALVSVVLLVGSAGWQAYRFFNPPQGGVTAFAHASDVAENGDDLGSFEPISAADATSSSPAEISQIGQNVSEQLLANYAFMKKAGTYTPETAQALGSSMASALRVEISRPVYTVADFATTSDISAARVARYQKDMAKALAPLKTNTQSELGLFADYVNTHDTASLDKLRAIAGAYRQAAENASHVTVPRDALAIHTDGLNAFQEFGAALAALADNADDPITAATLLLSYNKAEDDLRAALAAYTTYYAAKQ